MTVDREKEAAASSEGTRWKTSHGLGGELAPQGRMQPIAHIVGHHEQLAVAIKLNRFARRIKHNLAVGTLADVLVKHFLKFSA